MKKMREQLNEARIVFFNLEHRVQKIEGSPDNPTNDRYKLMNNHGEIDA